ncbi:AAA family ATPase [Paenibacillus sp. VMFN-D1]|uniref:AAA family ATPase n=1 Tax=Paenibacillus sp. VMFN-D1 TaxID=2135608 RepID=UPI000E282072|nr:AAA family ATPase [Paenibacillus sp. VMFN-D1]RED31441.1 chloramphenicol 3-O-phosphotransferase [Paenibacillus sp. VMFN-D1]
MAAHSIQQPAVIVITGIMASGKSTVAQQLAERTGKSVHLRGDLFRRMIVNDRKEVEPDASEEELGQLLLRYRLAAQAADTYAGSGFTVVVQDVIVGRVLEDFLSFLQSRPVYLVVLCPSPEEVERREAQRAKKGYGAWTVDALNHVLHDETPRLGLWLDSSSLTPGETVDKIMSGIAEAKIR